MASPTEDDHFRPGIAALQASRADEAQVHFQAAIDAGLATTKSWLGLTLALLVLGDNRAAEVSVDEVLVREPHSLRGLIIKGDLLLGRDEQRQAVSHYNLVMRLAATLADIPSQLQQDLVRIKGRLEQISETFQAHLFDRLQAGGYRRDASSARFNHGLDMLMGKAKREDDAQPFPQKPHAFYLPDMPYQPFYPSEELPWVKEVEAATDAIEAELTAFLVSRTQAFAPYIHGGLELPGQTPETLKDHDNWTAAFLVRGGVEDPEWSTSCPTVSALMDALPLPAIKGFSPSVFFSKLKPGARIDPHTGLLNCRLICHVPLVVPDGCGLRVGDERRDVVRGEVLAFDDSINHEAWNNSADDRIVLIFDVWHPDLTEQERRDITSLLEAVSA